MQEQHADYLSYTAMISLNLLLFPTFRSCTVVQLACCVSLTSLGKLIA